MTLLYTLLAALAVMLASLIGVVSVWNRLGDIIERNLSVLVSFSAGVFLLIGYGLASETLEHAESTTYALFWVASGALLLWIIFKFLPSFHHHHTEEDHSHQHSHIDARRILLSDAIHNTGDGLLLAAAFAVSIPFGIVTTASVFLHEIVQEVSEFFVLRQAGYKTAKALTYNFFVSGTIFLGAISGYFLLDLFETFEVPILGISAGALFIVVLNDLIPHSIRSSKANAQYGRHILWFTIGALLMLTLNTVVGHGEEAHVNSGHIHNALYADEQEYG